VGTSFRWHRRTLLPNILGDSRLRNMLAAHIERNKTCVIRSGENGTGTGVPRYGTLARVPLTVYERTPMTEPPAPEIIATETLDLGPFTIVRHTLNDGRQVVPAEDTERVLAYLQTAPWPSTRAVLERLRQCMPPPTTS
jgi:hypothetical protein